MWPPIWGKYFWHLKHSGALAYQHRTLTDVEAQQLATFEKLLCLYLPCPNCTMHCIQYTQKQPLKFHTGEDYWRHTVDFHNAVNQRLKRLTYSYAEAQELWTQSFLPDQVTPATVQFETRFDWWRPVLFAIHNLHTLGAQEATPEEEARFKTFLLSYTYVAPFAQQPEVATAMRSSLPTLRFRHEKDAWDSLAQWYSQVATLLHEPTLNAEELKRKFEAIFTGKQMKDLHLSQKQRMEDHAKLIALQKELHEKSQTETHAAEYRTATIVLACVLALSLALHLLRFYRTWRISKLSPVKTTLSPTPS